MTKVRDLHKKWSNDPKYKKAYKDLEDEFAVAQAIIEARTRVGLTQAQLAKRMKTTQSVIARLESGKADHRQQHYRILRVPQVRA